MNKNTDNFWQDKVVWITGASSGIGEALAKQLAQLGARLVLSARREEVLLAVKASYGGNDLNTLVLPMDLAQHQNGFEKECAQVIDHFGHIDVLICNAGLSQRALFDQMQLSVFQNVIAVNFLSVVALVKAVQPHMLARKSGSIVGISSVVGKFATPMRSAYSASKHALNGFLESLRAEVYSDNIHVLTVMPGYVSTNISYNAVLADGSKQNQLDKGQAGGMSVELCADKILRGIYSRKSEIYPAGLKELSGVYIRRFFPSLMERIVRRVNVKSLF